LINNIKEIEIKNCIVDEIQIRERTDGNVNLTSTKDNWQVDTYMLARFMNNLEAGNIDNSGIELLEFVIKRRKITETNSIVLGRTPYVQNRTLEFIDPTQTNESYVYSVVPVSKNGLEGKPSEVSISSEFAGWFIYDKETKSTLAFDKYFGSGKTVEYQLNQNRIQIDTLSQFPQIYYTPQQYHSFSLSTVVLAEDWSRSGNEYERILNNFILQKKPFLIKGSNGSLYVCDIGNPRVVTPQNAFRGNDYIEITIDAVEIMKYEDYMNESAGV